MLKKLTVLQIIILLLIFLSFFITLTTAFAHWRTVTAVGTVDVILVHDEIELVVTDLSPEGEEVVLVPKGQSHFPKDVEIIERMYAVEVAAKGIKEANLRIEAFDVTIGDDALYAHLVKIDISGQGADATVLFTQDTILVLVSITLQEPIDEEEVLLRGLTEDSANVTSSQEAYRAIKNQDIVFRLRFTLNENSANKEN